MKLINETTIQADEGMLLTNGTAFGSIVMLGKNDSIDNWYEITEEEAERLQNTEPTETETPTDEATETDYINALEELGVNFNE
jgi:hypothetical protein